MTSSVSGMRIYRPTWAILKQRLISFILIEAIAWLPIAVLAFLATLPETTTVRFLALGSIVLAVIAHTLAHTSQMSLSWQIVTGRQPKQTSLMPWQNLSHVFKYLFLLFLILLPLPILLLTPGILNFYAPYLFEVDQKSFVNSLAIILFLAISLPSLVIYIFLGARLKFTLFLAALGQPSPLKESWHLTKRRFWEIQQFTYATHAAFWIGAIIILVLLNSLVGDLNLFVKNTVNESWQGNIGAWATLAVTLRIVLLPLIFTSAAHAIFLKNLRSNQV